MKRYYFVSEIVVGVICVLIFIGSFCAILFANLSSTSSRLITLAGVTIGYWGAFFSFFDVRDEDYYDEDDEETDQQTHEIDLNVQNDEDEDDNEN